MCTVPTLLTIARSWIGTPFAHQGRTRGLRVDCLGFILETCREAGVMPAVGLPPTWDYTGYGRLADQYHLVAQVERYLQAVPVPTMRVGDLAVFATSSGLPAHLGFVADGAQPFSLLHAYGARTARLARVQEHRLGPGWLRHLHSVYRLPLEG